MDETQQLRQLLDAVRDGDATAAVELCRKYEPFIRAAVRRHLNERLRTHYDSLDFVQDVWSSVLTSPDNRTFDTPQAFIGYLTRIAQFKVIEVFRQRFQTQKNDISREQPLLVGEDRQEVTASRLPTPSQVLIAEETWDRLRNRLPVGHQVVLELLRDGHSYEDIALLSNVSLSTVNRIVRRLKELSST